METGHSVNAANTIGSHLNPCLNVLIINPSNEQDEDSLCFSVSAIIKQNPSIINSKSSDLVFVLCNEKNLPQKGTKKTATEDTEKVEKKVRELTVIF